MSAARVCVAAVLTAAAAFSQGVTLSGVDPSLLAEIGKIPLFDNHSHIPRLVAEGERDDEYDALPCEQLQGDIAPFRWRPDAPEIIAGWRALYGAADARQAIAVKRKRMAESGDDYPSSVLDRLGVDIVLANRIAMGRGLPSKRFRWVPFADALLFPLNNAALRINPDLKVWFDREDMLRGRYVKESGLSALPATLDDYQTRVVTATLERWKRAGAVAIKFEAAYLRTLRFEQAPEAEARRVYRQPPGGRYKLLQDYLFRYIAREAGRIGLAMHIHVGAGCGSYFTLDNAWPLNLEPTFNDPALRGTKFVILHGGVPMTRQIGYLVLKPNVYADFSIQGLLLYPRALAGVLREWLELAPSKILYGADVGPGPPEASWEESMWTALDTSRQALALALSGMIADGEITREQAIALARGVLRENARNLYGF